MPATSSLATEFSMDWDDICDQLYGNSANCANAPKASTDGGGNSVTNAWAQTQFLDHRISEFDPLMSYTAPAASALLSGKSNPHFPTIIPGVAATGVNYADYLGSLSSWNTAVQVTNKSAWSTVIPYNYVCDEPSASGMAGCITAAKNDQALSPVMPTLMAATYANVSAGGGLNYIDYWVVENACMFINLTTSEGGTCGTQTGNQNTSQLPVYSSWRSGKSTDGIPRQLWVYKSCSSAGTCGNGTVGPNDFNYPNSNIDGRPTSNRAMEWMTFMNTQSGELLYAVFCVWPGTSCYWGNNSPHDPWVSIYAFGENGDGTLMYPSVFTCNSSMDYPQTSCPYASKQWVTQQSGSALTTPILIPSMRMKYKRDGMQDYEYLRVLTTLGYGSYVNTQLSSWITNLDSYEYSGTGLQTARMNLGTKLHQLTYSIVLLPPPTLNGTVQ